ncbi:GntR family transcriptional regulator [Sphaerisporangium aureirubrum]|uniref:GntR family transcriptional regulator n=1 Tax=Sphaerisporangium aureirubrum TaxID=1544736 RepID=A0ABW1NVP1_9ACTN
MIQWERGSPVWAEGSAKWKQLVQELRERIESGRYPPGRRIPSQRQLNEEFELSRDTIRQSVWYLIEKRVLRIEQGVGTVVEPREKWLPMDDL